MSIVSSLIVSNRIQSNGSHKIRESHTDHLGNPPYTINYIADAGFNFNAKLAENAIRIDEQTKVNEIEEGIAACYAGLDPLNTIPFNPITPKYQTWDELAFGVSVYFLEQDNQLELQYWALSNNNISSTDKKRIWGMGQLEVSAVNGDVQIAVDTQASLDLYQPPFVNGVIQ